MINKEKYEEQLKVIQVVSRMDQRLGMAMHFNLIMYKMWEDIDKSMFEGQK